MPIDDNEPGAGGVNDGPAPPPGVTTSGTGAGIYVKIAVPNFNGAGPKAPQMQSYLRLGAIEPEVPPGKPFALQNGIDITGEDLASLVQGFADDVRVRTLVDPPELAAAGLGTVTTDMGAEKNGLPPEQLPPGTTAAISTFPADVNSRLAESAVLHTKGGWRDHSDGNRITTTRGDKVEVIRGNYKMVILGRQNLSTTPGDDYYFDDWATGVDESGGLSDNQDQSRGVNGVLAVQYTWQKNSDGRWGWTQVTMTGAYDTSASSVTGKTTQGNGRQIAFTWVDAITSITGGPGNLSSTGNVMLPTDSDYDGRYDTDSSANPMKRVDRIYNRTWVNVLDELTDAAGSVSEVVQTAGNMKTTTTAGGDMTTTTTAGGAMTTNIVSGGHSPLTTITQSPQSMTTITTAQTTMNTTTATLGLKYTVDPSTGAVGTAYLAAGFPANAAIAMNNTVQSAGTMTNVTQADGSITNRTKADTFIFEETWAPLHTNIELSLMLLELKLFQHHDIHGLAHFDVHALMHNDIHIGPHLTVDVLGSTKIFAGTDLDISSNKTFLAGLLLAL